MYTLIWMSLFFSGVKLDLEVLQQLNQFGEYPSSVSETTNGMGELLLGQKCHFKVNQEKKYFF